jgi:hypothetical protein
MPECHAMGNIGGSMYLHTAEFEPRGTSAVEALSLNFTCSSAKQPHPSAAGSIVYRVGGSRATTWSVNVGLRSLQPGRLVRRANLFASRCSMSPMEWPLRAPQTRSARSSQAPPTPVEGPAKNCEDFVDGATRTAIPSNCSSGTPPATEPERPSHVTLVRPGLPSRQPATAGEDRPLPSFLRTKSGTLLVHLISANACKQAESYRGC